jgi:hypothetical protein
MLLHKQISLFSIFSYICAHYGGLAQLARACAWQAQGQGFDSPNLHRSYFRVAFLFLSFFDRISEKDDINETVLMKSFFNRNLTHIDL